MYIKQLFLHEFVIRCHEMFDLCVYFIPEVTREFLSQTGAVVLGS